MLGSEMGATFADRHQVFSHVGSGELPGAHGRSREVSMGICAISRGVILGPISTLWEDFGTTFGVTLWKVSCPRRRNVLTFAKIYCGDVQVHTEEALL